MGVRTASLDLAAEKTLERLRKLKGLSNFELLKRGLTAYERQAVHRAQQKPYDIDLKLSLGEGGCARAGR